MVSINCPRLPNFFVVGTAKAGTTSIGHYLSQHPEVYVSPIKEPFYFSRDIRKENFRSGYRRSIAFDVEAYLGRQPLRRKPVAHIEDLSQYLSLFREVENEKAIGELSTGYLYSSCAADNIFELNPSAKIVIVLRQPVERAYSHYLMGLRGYEDSSMGFIGALESDLSNKNKGWGSSHLYVELGLYFEQVSRYLRRFPESQVKILLYEDLKDNPVQFLRELCEFLEVDLSALGVIDITERKNVAALPRFKIPQALFPVVNVLNSFANKYLPGWIKAWIRGVMFSSKNVPKLGKDEFEQAMKYFKEDIQRLSVLIKRDLSRWYEYGN